MKQDERNRRRYFSSQWGKIGRGLFFLLIFTLAFEIGGTAASRKETRKEGRTGVDWTCMTDYSLDHFPLIELLNLRAKSDGFSYLIDRRIDPETPITFSSEPVPLIEGLTKAMAAVPLDVVLCGDLLYIGPPGSGGILLLDTALRKQERRFSGNPNSERLTKPIRMEGPDGAVPSEMLAEMAKEIKFSWEKLHFMPFDCWREIHTAPIPAGEAFSLILIGFNVTWSLDEKKAVLRPVPLDLEKSVTRIYSAEDSELLRRIDRQKFPGVEIAEVAGTLHASGTFAQVAELEYAVEQERIQGQLAQYQAYRKEAEDAGGIPRGERVVSGEIQEGSLEAIFRTLENQLGIRSTLDQSVQKRGISLETRISCEFDRVNAKKAAGIVADTLGISVRLTGNEAVFYAE